MQIIEEKYNWKGQLSKRTAPTDFIILHHAAMNGTAQDVHRAHLNNNWAGIGYHYYVRKDGSVYRGRPLDTIGAHAVGYNDRSVGICCEGNYMIDTMSIAQQVSVVELCRDLLTIYPKAKIVGHRDCVPTACPGANFPLAEIQRDALSMTPAPSSWAAASWQKAVSAGVLDGTNPQGPLTREMLAVVLDRLGMLSGPGSQK